MQLGASERSLTPYLSEPFTIGPVSLPNRVVLAPMAGLTCSAYRRHMRSHGAGLLVSEMVSVLGLLHGNKRTADYLAFDEQERPFSVQLFGAERDSMARAAELVLMGPRTPDLLDINMGCPVRKVAKTGAGCALMARSRAGRCGSSGGSESSRTVRGPGYSQDAQWSAAGGWSGVAGRTPDGSCGDSGNRYPPEGGQPVLQWQGRPFSDRCHLCRREHPGHGFGGRR